MRPRLMVRQDFWGPSPSTQTLPLAPVHYGGLLTSATNFYLRRFRLHLLGFLLTRTPLRNLSMVPAGPQPYFSRMPRTPLKQERFSSLARAGVRRKLRR